MQFTTLQRHSSNKTIRSDDQFQSPNRNTSKQLSKNINTTSQHQFIDSDKRKEKTIGEVVQYFKITIKKSSNTSAILNDLLNLPSQSTQSKIKRLVTQFQNLPHDRSMKLKIIQENLEIQEAIHIFYKIDHYLKFTQLEVDDKSLFFQFQAMLLESLFQASKLMVSPRQNQLFEILNQNHQNILKFTLFTNKEQLQCSLISIMQMHFEMCTLAAKLNLEQNLIRFQQDFKVNVEYLFIYFQRAEIKFSLIFALIAQNLSNSDLFQIAFSTSIQNVQKLESNVFSIIRQSNKPSENQIKNLVLSYLLLSELLLLAQKNNKVELILELMMKSGDCNISELRKEFIKNCMRFAQKYLQSDQSLHDKLIYLNKKIGIEYSILNYSQNHKDIGQKKQISEGIIVLLEMLDLQYMRNQDYEFSIEQLCSVNLLDILIDKIKQTIKQEGWRDQQQEIENNKVKEKNTSNRKQEIKKEVVVKQQKQTVSQQKVKIQEDEHQKMQEKKYEQQRLQQEQKQSQEYERLVNEMKQHQQELIQLKNQYQQQLTAKQNEPQTPKISPQEIEKLKIKINSLESTLTILRNENADNKNQKQTKESEIVGLKTHIIELQEKQIKIEKLIEIQQKQQTIENNKQQMDQSIQSKKETFPDKTQKQSSQISDFNLKEIEENQTNASRGVTQNILQLLQANNLDSTFAFTKFYSIHSINTNSNTSDSSIWESDFSESIRFKIDVQICSSQEEGKQLQIRAFQTSTGSLISTEYINFEILKNLLTFLEISDVLPSNLPITSITNTHQFFKHLILPFVAITQQEDSNYKIQIWPKAPGFLSGLNLRMDFLDINGLIFFHHLESDQFRILICDPFSMEAVKLDVEMDYSSLDYFFQSIKSIKKQIQDAKQIKDEFIRENKEYLMNMTDKKQVSKTLEEFEKEGIEERLFVKSKVDEELQKIKEDKEERRSKPYEQEILVLSKPKELLNLIKKGVHNLDQKLKQENMNTFQNLVYGLKYFKFRVWNAGSRGQIQIVKDNQDKKELNIYLKNTFETFGPNKKKLQVQGHGIHRYEMIQKDFSVDFQKLAQDEKQTILSQLVYGYNLTIFEKAIDQTEEQFDKNPIVHRDFDHAQYKRLICYDQGTNLCVLTMSVMGLNVIGQVGLFDIEECFEQGVFLPCTQSDWFIDQSSKIKRTMENVPFSEYLLTQMFKNNTVTKIMIQKILSVEYKSEQERLNIKSQEIGRRKQFIERIENLLNWEEISQIDLI